MDATQVREYHERTLKRLVELINKQARDGEQHSFAWLTKKLIEDNTKMAKTLANMYAGGGHQEQIQG